MRKKDQKPAKFTLCGAAVAFNLMPFTGLPDKNSPLESPPHLTGISLGTQWGSLVGTELMTMGATSSQETGSGSATVRQNAHILLTGLKTGWVQISAGPAWAETITTSGSAFRHATQGGIWVAKLAFAAPLVSGPDWVLSFCAGHLQRLAAGAPVSSTTQVYHPATESTPPSLSLNDGATEDRGIGLAPIPLPTERAPETLLDDVTTIGISLQFRL